ncbi:hypothetical protein ZWY2020_011777 [Hordeum vulgare]|nr:hypothetical protein ZWY2020_011777 [Hordeum vulgare]
MLSMMAGSCSAGASGKAASSAAATGASAGSHAASAAAAVVRRARRLEPMAKFGGWLLGLPEKPCSWKSWGFGHRSPFGSNRNGCHENHSPCCGHNGYPEHRIGVIYNVGEPGGAWDLSTNYLHWAPSRNFHPSDQIVFKYSPQAHDVLEVSKADYDSCSTASPIATLHSGNDVVYLTATVPAFICAFRPPRRE